MMCAAHWFLALVASTTALGDGGRPGTIGLDRAPDYVNVYYSSPQRDELICASARYTATLDLRHPAVVGLSLPGGGDLLAGRGIRMELEDETGKVYSSRFAPQAARQNTWRAGLYYYDAHALDFDLATAEGEPAPVRGELVLHCFPDKLHVQGRFHANDALRIRRAEVVMECGSAVQPAEGGRWATLQGAERSLAVVAGTQELACEGARLRAGLAVSQWQAGQTYDAYVALLPGDSADLEGLARQELAPLPREAFTVSGGTAAGYDAARGLYVIHGTPGHSNYGFEGFWNNPNMYLTANIAVRNDDLARRLYVMHDNPAGPVEAGILTDSHGFALPIAVQACKNFAGENEEPDDSAFSETYFPLTLRPGQEMELSSHHLHQNWGDHPLRQVSSIRFFEIYYHLSQGVTETTCFSLPTKFGSIPGGERRPYTIADYRPLSGQTWMGQPQHEHVALQGWLTYFDGTEWRWPRFTGTTILSTGPNLAWFIQTYQSSDGKVDETVEAFEMPQQDETRTFLRIRYDFRQDVEIAGDPRHSLRLLNKGSYIRRVHWKTLAWTDEAGQVQTRPMTQDGSWSAEGLPMRPYNAFVCAYPHVDGNDSVIIRSFRGEVGGKPFSRLGFSAIGHPDNKTELMLTPLIEGNRIPAGSWVELDCILMPYGDDTSGYSRPRDESVRHGLNAERAAELLPAEAVEKLQPLVGPRVTVQHGEKVLDLPPTVRVTDNWARFSFSGAHDRVAVVVTGFSKPSLPMLWEGSTWLDQQVKGGDGYQAFTNSDGTYGFVFAPRTRTTRHGGKWDTTTHHYLATQVVSTASITRAQTLNGEVVLQLAGEAQTTLDSPRLWCPATNVLSRSRPVNATTCSAAMLSTVPAALEGDWREATWTIERYRPEELSMRIAADGPATLRCDGAAHGGLYEVRVGDEVSKLAADGSGSLRISVSAGPERVVTARLVGEG